jgi:hypothetical protein
MFQGRISEKCHIVSENRVGVFSFPIALVKKIGC